VKPAWLAVALLAGCASAPLPQVVRVPVPVPCLRGPVEAPPAVSTDQELARLTNYEFPLVIMAERDELLVHARKAYAERLACARPAEVAP